MLRIPVAALSTPLGRIRKLVIGSPNWLGDVMMAEPLLRAIQRDGRFETFLLCKPQVFDLCRAFRNHLPSIAVATHATAPSTRFAPDDTLWVNLAMTPDLPLLALRCGARFIWGYPRHDTAHLLGEWLGPEFVAREQHHVHNYLSLLFRLGIDLPDEMPVPRLVAFDRHSPSPTGGLGARIVVLNTSSSNQESKRFPAERFRELADLLLERFRDIEIRLNGLTGDADRNAAIARACRDPDRCIDSSGSHDLSEMIALLAGSRLVISNDTGPMHIAAALGVATIGIFGPTSPAWTAPLGTNAYHVRTRAACAPCFTSPCPLPPQVCFDDVAPLDVMRVVEEHRLL
jgi:heptosyltransferase-2